ncbi:5-deoxy-glucuronate isomerase [Opitutales bacterium ASA1]|uniref:5-deoxy-glucuronate isomerase n=1 Tax=Congregicoccus parvus TaxID=3081749 RepID=UPI002B2F2520|nr:5-deoxy-glucuronate isomerase [Opitutales bacterium ASA1]
MAPHPKQTTNLAACVHRGPQRSWRPGLNTVVAESPGDGLDARMSFGVHALSRGRRLDPVRAKETLCILLRGRARIHIGTTTHVVERSSLFDEGPTAVHAGPGSAFDIVSETASEWVVVSTENTRAFPARLYRNDEFTTEDRGAGLAQGACRRLVRTIFDHSTRPESNLVVGEVVNFPGRWSSYPPHHHPQPEIYHYRFTEPQGYGHAELGDAVFKVRDRDTVVIPGGLDHAQVSAPGYGMYYLWIVRHLPRRPYKGFTYTKEHTWLLDPARQGWSPDRIPTPPRA